MSSNFKFQIVPDKASFTGYSFMSLEEPTKPGVPASNFEVELWQELERTRKERDKLRKIVDKIAK